jgi:opacity protein-like surface antigen
MRKQALAKVISISLVLSVATVAQAVAQPSAATSSGFYGGVSMRDRGGESQGLTFGPAPPFTTRFSASSSDETSSRSLLFGGYRFANDISVEASFASSDKYSLRPADSSTPRGVGLNLATGARSLTDLPARSWNVDVLTSWSFLRSFSLYGRLGYVQTDAQSLAAPSVNVADPRRLREGVNYGVGLRYDVSSALGLKLEYSRFGGRFAGEFSSVVPESDQLSVGLQLRF